jgi:hypothetical protein
MSRFVVTYRPGAVVSKHGPLAITAEKTEVLIEADYFKLEAGHLVFRDNGSRGSYPVTVKVIAPGIWAEVDQEL